MTVTVLIEGSENAACMDGYTIIGVYADPDLALQEAQRLRASARRKNTFYEMSMFEVQGEETKCEG